MSDHADSNDHESNYATERQTAPQSEYGLSDVAFGFVIALVGMAIVFGIPLLLT